MQNILQKIFFLLLFPVTTLNAQTFWANQVINFQFGSGQTFGQTAPYFPSNVLGSATPSATTQAPANLPSDVLSLGRNGWIILGFERTILNGAGADFIVFENAFEYGNGEIFDEWLQVSVSEDGQTWYDFPVDTLTGAGFAGRTPTNSAGNFADMNLCGGDAFDLATLGLPQINYVKLQDATRFQQDPTKIAAEVDAVAALHGSTALDTEVENALSIHYLPESWDLTANISGELRLYSTDFRLCQSLEVQQNEKIFLSKANYSPGIYLLQFSTSTFTETYKLIK